MSGPTSVSTILLAASIALLVSNPLAYAQRTTTKSRGRAPAPVVQAAPDPKAVIERIKPALVVIRTTDRTNMPLSFGSGFAIANSPYVLTNLHVFKWARGASVEFVASGLTTSDFVIAGFDVRRDLCLLQLRTTVERGLRISSTPVTEGDEVIAAGNPEGLSGTFSRGMVSALRPADGVFQMDAPISHGSSGGPVVNMTGDAVGVASSSVTSGQNLNFAVTLAGYKPTAEWALSVAAVGALAVSDREKDGLVGPVARVECVTVSDTRYSPVTEIDEYDDMGNKTLHVTSNANGVTFSDKSTYDKSGVLTSRSTYIRGYQESQTTAYTPADGIDQMFTNRTLATEEYDSGSTHYSVVFDSQYRAVTVTTTENEDVTRVFYVYDEGGRLADTRDFSNGSPTWVTHYVYTFDGGGNWIAQIASSTFVPTGEVSSTPPVRRTITYH